MTAGLTDADRRRLLVNVSHERHARLAAELMEDAAGLPEIVNGWMLWRDNGSPRRVRLSELSGYSYCAASDTTYLRFKTTGIEELSGSHVESLDRYFAEQKESA